MLNYFLFNENKRPSILENRINVSSHNRDKFITGNSYPIEKSQKVEEFFLVPSNNYLTTSKKEVLDIEFTPFEVFPRNSKSIGLGNEFRTIIWHSFGDKTVGINGPINLSFHLEVDTPIIELSAHIMVYRDGKFLPLDNLLQKNIRLYSKEGIVKDEFKTGPIFEKIKNGDILYITIQNSTPRFLNLFNYDQVELKTIKVLHKKGFPSKIRFQTETLENGMEDTPVNI